MEPRRGSIQLKRIHEASNDGTAPRFIYNDNTYSGLELMEPLRGLFNEKSPTRAILMEPLRGSIQLKRIHGASNDGTAPRFVSMIIFTACD